MNTVSLSNTNVHLTAFACFAMTIVPLKLTAQAVDTSEWACEFCPFETGLGGDYEIGATSVSDDSAYIGDATGYDEAGTYADIGGHGDYAQSSHRLRWTLEDLGLDSRFVAVDGTQAGWFDYRLTYREIPRRVFNTTQTVFVSSGDTLTLPDGWVQAPETSGFTSLDASLYSRDIESDRAIFDVGASYRPHSNWTLTANYRHQDVDGNTELGGSYYTNAAILPVDLDYATDELDVGLHYGDTHWSLSLGWYLSEFDNGGTSFDWQHPFTTAPGAEFAALAQPPGNRFQQLSLAAGYTLPVWNAIASLSAAVGEIEQTEPFPPYTSNASLATMPLPRNDLAGQVDTTRIALAFSANPFKKMRIRLFYKSDERDNKTNSDLWNPVIADSFISGDMQANLPYSYKRSTFGLSAEYRLFRDIRVSAGYDRQDKDYDFQEIAEQTEDGGWGRVRWQPLSNLELDVRAGASKRDIDRYDDIVAASLGQNPLLRKYNLAYRYRQFGEISLSYSPTAWPVTFVMDAMHAEDNYTKSRLGLTSGEELRVGLDINWLVSEKTSVYISAGLDNLSSEQFGSESFGEPDWQASYDDDFSTFGAGLVLRSIADKFDLSVDFTHSYGDSTIGVNSLNAGTDEFPALVTDYTYGRAQLTYRHSERLDWNLDLRYQRFRSEDWAIEGVGPATVPVVLSLGEEPYSPEVFIVGISLDYRLGE